MKRFPASALILAGMLPCAGCLKTESSHVLYLSPGGAVTWAVTDRDVHSDEADRAKRTQEEADFLRAIQNRAHGPLVALEAIGGKGASTELIRSERPWEAVTTARFDRIDTLLASLLREFGIHGEATLSTAGDVVTLHVRWTDEEPSEEDTPAVALIEGLDAYRVVLTEGRFVAADGFVVSSDGRSATPAGQASSTGSERHVSLAWTAGR
jgi:hypothetical protein